MNGFYTWYRVDVVVTQMDVRGGPKITIYFHNKVIRLLRQYSAVNVERVGDYAKQMALNDSTVFRERKNPLSLATDSGYYVFFIILYIKKPYLDLEKILSSG